MLRTLSDRTTEEGSYQPSPLCDTAVQQQQQQLQVGSHTFIFADVFQRKGQPGVLSFDDPDFAKSALAHHAQESEVVEVDCD